MTSTASLVLRVSTVVTLFALAGCQEDTAIGANDPDGGSGGRVSGGGSGGRVSGGGSGGAGAGSGGASGANCPAGPSAPLGDACSSANQVCAYGYNVPHCGGRTVICKSGHWIEQSHSDPETACFDAGTGADTDANVSPRPEVGSDGNRAACCPRDLTMNGCMHLGGSNVSAHSCAETCEFFCSTNWRVEKDSNGCEVWVFDRRPPAPGENFQCIVTPPRKGS